MSPTEEKEIGRRGKIRREETARTHRTREPLTCIITNSLQKHPKQALHGAEPRKTSKKLATARRKRTRYHINIHTVKATLTSPTKEKPEGKRGRDEKKELELTGHENPTAAPYMNPYKQEESLHEAQDRRKGDNQRYLRRYINTISIFGA
ncbi:hypothetical protein BJ508DRAFT_313009 [Ascobolus immersus RN42]|uniref:Uncharacterized protein n=1 Tax=Ascobolus immersus RN42 TaxID=1160509 RepID=A0A3N4HX51_ASCIM|nr:hypothetical protein BJ508DRAFT_313009 [Ascobolus immersus RN42]